MSNPVEFRPRNAQLALLDARPATKVEFAGFESLEFYAYKMDGCWAIAEASTGLPVVRGMDSRYHAKDQAKARLEKMGLAKTKSAVAAQLERIRSAESEKFANA